MKFICRISYLFPEYTFHKTIQLTGCLIKWYLKSRLQYTQHVESDKLSWHHCDTVAHIPPIGYFLLKRKMLRLNSNPEMFANASSNGALLYVTATQALHHSSMVC